MYIVLTNEDLNGLTATKDLSVAVMEANRLTKLTHKDAYVMQVVATLAPEFEEGKL